MFGLFINIRLCQRNWGRKYLTIMYILKKEKGGTENFTDYSCDYYVLWQKHAEILSLLTMTLFKIFFVFIYVQGA